MVEYLSSKIRQIVRDLRLDFGFLRSNIIFTLCLVLVVIVVMVVLVNASDVATDSLSARYPYLSYVSIGPPKIHQDSLSISFHRLITTQVEIYTYIYIEKILTDEEMYGKEVVGSYEVSLNEFFPKNHVGERILHNMYVDSWETYDSLRISVNNKIYRVIIGEDFSRIDIRSL